MHLRQDLFFLHELLQIPRLILLVLSINQHLQCILAVRLCMQERLLQQFLRKVLHFLSFHLLRQCLQVQHIRLHPSYSYSYSYSNVTVRRSLWTLVVVHL